MNTDKTAIVLGEMLKENTGRHFLDSGGAYGRHWERNQSRNFESELPSRVKFSTGNGHSEGIEHYHNLYHWLKERLDFAKGWQDVFDEFANTPELMEMSWSDCLEAFAAHLKKLGYTIGNRVDSFYTYNNENMVDQDFIAYVFDLEYDPEVDEKTGLDSGIYLIAIQIHNGCDARGGFTSPKFFEGSEDDYSIYDYARGTIHCDDQGEHWWETFNGGYSYESDYMPSFESLEFVDSELTPEEMNKKVRDYQKQLEYVLTKYQPLPGFEQPSFGLEPFSRGKILVDTEGNGYCPECGGKLSGYF